MTYRGSPRDSRDFDRSDHPDLPNASNSPLHETTSDADRIRRSRSTQKCQASFAEEHETRSVNHRHSMVQAPGVASTPAFTKFLREVAQADEEQERQRYLEKRPTLLECASTHRSPTQDPPFSIDTATGDRFLPPFQTSDCTKCLGTSPVASDASIGGFVPTSGRSAAWREPREPGSPTYQDAHDAYCQQESADPLHSPIARASYPDSDCGTIPPHIQDHHSAIPIPVDVGDFASDADIASRMYDTHLTDPPPLISTASRALGIPGSPPARGFDPNEAEVRVTAKDLKGQGARRDQRTPEYSRPSVHSPRQVTTESVPPADMPRRRIVDSDNDRSFELSYTSSPNPMPSLSRETRGIEKLCSPRPDPPTDCSYITTGTKVHWDRPRSEAASAQSCTPHLDKPPIEGRFNSRESNHIGFRPECYHGSSDHAHASEGPWKDTGIVEQDYQYHDKRFEGHTYEEDANIDWVRRTRGHTIGPDDRDTEMRGSEKDERRFIGGSSRESERHYHRGDPDIDREVIVSSRGSDREHRRAQNQQTFEQEWRPQIRDTESKSMDDQQRQCLEGSNTTGNENVIVVFEERKVKTDSTERKRCKNAEDEVSKEGYEAMQIRVAELEEKVKRLVRHVGDGTPDGLTTDTKSRLLTDRRESQSHPSGSLHRTLSDHTDDDHRHRRRYRRRETLSDRPAIFSDPLPDPCDREEGLKSILSSSDSKSTERKEGHSSLPPKQVRFADEDTISPDNGNLSDVSTETVVGGFKDPVQAPSRSRRRDRNRAEVDKEESSSRTRSSSWSSERIVKDFVEVVFGSSTSGLTGSNEPRRQRNNHHGHLDQRSDRYRDRSSREEAEESHRRKERELSHGRDRKRDRVRQGDHERQNGGRDRARMMEQDRERDRRRGTDQDRDQARQRERDRNERQMIRERNREQARRREEQEPRGDELRRKRETGSKRERNGGQQFRDQASTGEEQELRDGEARRRRELGPERERDREVRHQEDRRDPRDDARDSRRSR